MNVLNNVHEKYSRANVKCNHISKLSMEIPTTTITICINCSVGLLYSSLSFVFKIVMIYNQRHAHIVAE